MSRYLSLLLLQAVFTLPILGQSKNSLVTQVLSTARDFRDISNVLSIIREDKRVYSYVPSVSPIKEKYRLSGTFGYRYHPISHKPKFHSGVDMAASYASIVRATASGTISFAGLTRGYGKRIVITHKYGFVTAYAHLTYIYVQPGHFVRKGQCIGFVGSTGYSTGNHLHYEIIKNKRYIDPLPFLG